MGAVFSFISQALNQLLTGEREAKIVMVGLAASGKSTILYKLKLGGDEIPQTRPTIGSNLETIRRGKLKLEVWDLGGQSSLRVTWSAYFHETDGLVLVIDASDRMEMPKVKHELMLLLGNNDLIGVPLLVLANKQDIAGAMTPAEIAMDLSLDRIKDRPYTILGTVAITGKGLEQGFDWLGNNILAQKR